MSSAVDAGDDEFQPIDDKDARALTEYMIVLDDADPVDDDLPSVRGVEAFFLVVHVDEHVVDLRTGSCTCDDWFYREPAGGCKHRRRVEFAIGERDVPEWVDPSAIDSGLGDHVG